ncbi:MAG: hypothetical protein ABSG88_16615 [Bradyrhizobium sp.]
MAITGFSSSTFSNAGGAVTDLFSAVGAEEQGQISSEATQLKAQGDIAEAQQYGLAQTLAQQNEQFTAQSTAIQQARSTTMQIGGQQAAQAGAGFAASGSCLDILADSASQGALAKATLGQQGLITEAGYQEQAQSYGIMQSTATQAASEEEQIAQQQQSAASTAMFGDIAGGILKGAAAIAGLAIAPETGGLSFAAATTAVGFDGGIGSLY